MYKFRDLSIKNKLTAAIVATSISILILVSISFLITDAFKFRHQLKEELSSLADIIGNNASSALMFNDSTSAAMTLSALQAKPYILDAYIITNEQKIFARYINRDIVKSRLKLEDGTGKGPGFISSSELAALAKESESFWDWDLDLEMVKDIHVDKERIGQIIIRSDAREVLLRMKWFFVFVLIVIVLASLGAYLIASGIQRLITSPLLHLSENMRLVSRDKRYDLRVEKTSDDEIGDLIDGFNDMLEQIRGRDDKLMKYNEDLEYQVAKRTAELVDTQEELIRKEKLSMLGQISGSVGHELRNPLGVISNAVYYLKTVMSGADEGITEYLDIIKSEVDNSTSIITDLLDFSRTKTPMKEPIPASELIRRVLTKYMHPEGIGIRTEIEEPGPMVYVDPFQMGQVIHNLVTNGVQAMPAGGDLVISAQKVVRDPGPVDGLQGRAQGVSRQEDYKLIEISVTDAGEGISAENMKKLFQPLFTTKRKGIGLGLTICKSLTEANGGWIKVESLVGKGTTFTLTLPSHEGHA